MTEGTKYCASGRPSEFSLDVSPRIADDTSITEHSPLTLNANGNANTIEEQLQSTVVVIDENLQKNLIPSTSVVADWNVPGTERAHAVDIYHSPAYYNCYPPPIFILSISLVQIAGFCYDWYTAPDDSPLIYNSHRRYEIWRYLSYMLLHNGRFHLAVNIFGQLSFGIPLEMVHKSWRLAIIYLLGVLAGSLAISLAKSNILAAGASGGVYALVGATLTNFALNWAVMGRLFGFLMVLLSGFGIGAILSVLYDLISAVKGRHYAHLFGAVAGVLAGGLVLRNLMKLTWERKARWLCLAALVSLFFALIVCNLISLH